MGRKRFELPTGQSLWEEIAALAEQRKHRRQSAEQIAAVKKGIRLANERRQREATERSIARRKEKHKQERAERQAKRVAYQEGPRRSERTWVPKIGHRRMDWIALHMEPGQWYGSGDLVAMCAMDKNPISRVLELMLEGGYLERRQNAAWKPPLPYRGECEPKWLYRLTAAGEALRGAVWLLQ